MPWVRLADDFPDHPKIVAAGAVAGWLWACGIAYANRYLTDGFLPRAQVRRLADVDDPYALADRLVDVGLWERDGAGYRIHDYLDYQPPAESVKAEREKTARRVATWRERHRADDGNAERNDVRNGVTNAARNGVSTGAPGPGPGPGPVNTPVPAATSSPLPPPPQAGEGAGKRRTKHSAEIRRDYAGALCPANCATTHGGPTGEQELRARWLARPSDDAGSWADFAALHGRKDLAGSEVPTGG